MAVRKTTPAAAPRVPHVGTYRRELPVGLDRLYENAIDWEHLPYLHRTSFAKIECLDAGQWGFRARVWPQPFDGRRTVVIELKLDRECRRWITSTLEGPGLGSEVWTHAFAMAERQTLIVVDFFVPGADEDRAPQLGSFYKDLYARLYDEDVWMMSTRQAQLDLIKSGKPSETPARRVLGTIDEVRARLPLSIEAGGRQFRIVEVGGEFIAHATVCPHSLGPLENATIESGTVECPWHGYRYDIRTRQCVNGAKCSLAPAPEILVDKTSSSVSVEWSPDI